jgi:hypothetical protein
LAVIDGVIAGMVLQRQALKAQHPFCGASGVTGEQEVRVVVKYIDERPERLHEPFPTLAYEAVKAAWACKPDQAGK